jgi:hypothetical protein
MFHILKASLWKMRELYKENPRAEELSFMNLTKKRK